MNNTKEKILCISLELFAKDGYEAVSVSMIASKLGITKGALYKHYKNKRDIFDSIVARMSELDAKYAKAYNMPEKTADEDAEAYKRTKLENIKAFSKQMFRHWTTDEFCANFRKMLTLEQYRSPEIGRLYQQYLASGPMMYMTDIFAEYVDSKSQAMQLALEFYGAFFLLYSAYDGAEDKSSVICTADRHIKSFIDRIANNGGKTL
ncbi:MAG: TetR/AcrR family transcriptional regulator [Acutalibacteraceae bacterium]